MMKLNEEIENLRELLVEYTLKKGLRNPETLAISQQLDLKINEYMHLKSEQKKPAKAFIPENTSAASREYKKRLHVREWLLC